MCATLSIYLHITHGRGQRASVLWEVICYRPLLSWYLQMSCTSRSRAKSCMGPMVGRSLITGLHLWQGAGRLIGRHLPFWPKMHLARFWISVLEKRSSAQQPTVCVRQQLFLLSLSTVTNMYLYIYARRCIFWLKFLPLLVPSRRCKSVLSDACLDLAAVYTHVDLCAAPPICVLTQKMSNNSIPAHYSYTSIVWLWIFWVIKRNLGVRYVCAGPFLFLLFIGKCAFDANNMSSFVLTHCRVAFHPKYFFNTTDCKDLFQHIRWNEITQ